MNIRQLAMESLLAFSLGLVIAFTAAMFVWR